MVSPEPTEELAVSPFLSLDQIRSKKARSKPADRVNPFFSKESRYSAAVIGGFL
jgi:hypothetical protein